MSLRFRVRTSSFSVRTSSEKWEPKCPSDTAWELCENFFQFLVSAWELRFQRENLGFQNWHPPCFLLDQSRFYFNCFWYFQMDQYPKWNSNILRKSNTEGPMASWKKVRTLVPISPYNFVRALLPPYSWSKNFTSSNVIWHRYILLVTFFPVPPAQGGQNCLFIKKSSFWKFSFLSLYPV